MDLCADKGVGAEFPPSELVLPSESLEEVADHVRKARRLLTDASDVRWQSVAADRFRSVLEDADVMLGWALAGQQEAHEAWRDLRVQAAQAGHRVI